MREISKCEEQVMITVWDSEVEPNAKSIHVEANKRFNRKWASQTVTTFLIRLCKKEWLEIRKEGKCAYYHPVVSKEEYRKDKVYELLNDLYDGDIEMLKADLKK